MIRTIYPAGTFQVSTVCPIINGVLCRTTYSIDRIQISVNYKCYSYCLNSFKQAYTLIRAYKLENRFIYSFRVGKSTLQLVKYTGKHRVWCQLAIQDPTKSAQTEVVGIIIKALDHFGLPYQDASVTQVEFAMDFKPFHPSQNNLNILSRWFNQSTVMKHSRLGSVGVCDTTGYRGKNGNIYKGSKGVRTYRKENFCRLELQVNKGFLRNRIGISDLPINKNSLNIFDSVKFRQPLNQQRVDKINKSIKKEASSKYQKLIFSIMQKEIDRLLDEPNPIVQNQIDTIKQVTKEVGLRFVQDKCFPEF